MKVLTMLMEVQKLLGIFWSQLMTVLNDSKESVPEAVRKGKSMLRTSQWKYDGK
jgi:hypothetical protein